MPAFTLERAEERKIAHYSGPREQEELDVILLAIDIYGQVGKSGLGALNDPSSLMPEHRGKHPVSEFHALRIRVSSLAIRYTAVMTN